MPRRALWLAALAPLLMAAILSQSFPAGFPDEKSGQRLILEIIDQKTGKQTPARFSLLLDGRPFFPEKVGTHGLRFVTVHESRQQILVVTYARGTGLVEVALPPEARKVTIQVAKGLEYFPEVVTRELGKGPVQVRVELRRWSNLADKGWSAADAHVHYDRLARTEDKDWLTMLAGDDLQLAHFLVLKGGKVPGVWARQHAYGKEGEAFDGERLIRSGEEYRDTLQGHILLIGIGKVIEPISTGGIGQPPVPFNYPPLYDVFGQCRKLDGLGGVAHGGALGRQPTALADAVLGAIDFMEIGNTHLYALELWYRLLNCGYRLPPSAGTDLPNYPFRDPWQPFLGEMRMYVRVAERRDFEAWKQAVKSGAAFVTSGPMLAFTVNGAGPGQVIRLPAKGGDVTIEAELATPVGLKKLELVHNGKPAALDVEKALDRGVHRWRARKTIRVESSGWLATRGEGVTIQALDEINRLKQPWLKDAAVAHSGPIYVEVGDQPTWSDDDARHLLETLHKQRDYYAANGSYQKGDDRLRVQELFDRAIDALKKRGRGK